MHFFVLAALFTAIIAAPSPSNNVARDVICGDPVYSQPRCCDRFVAGDSDKDCFDPPNKPHDLKHLVKTCKAYWVDAECCTKEVPGKVGRCKEAS